ncbi:MAG: hypothetical protein HYX61_10155 [Gammaproteobacteria bacterium]|jgi:hypothetical protein|nr:hypothetical protein [Gammaproteobacteria bacterium]
MLNTGPPKIEFLSYDELVNLAAEKILSEQDPSQAPSLFTQVFTQQEPRLWAAFLQNEVLRVILFNTNLKKILNAVKEKLSKDVVDNRDEWEKILVIIAQNPNWCRELSYSSFIAMAEVSPILRDYITSTESFCAHLEPFHIGVLATQFPNNLDKLIQTLLEALKDGKYDDKQFWAKSSLKRLIILSEDARIKISCNLEYRFILLVLKEEFKIDRFFAKEVLKIPYVVKIWLGRNELFAYKHQLLTNKDFKELSDHYKYINMRVSQTYENFYLEEITEMKEEHNNKSTFRNLSLEYEEVCNKFEVSDHVDASNNVEEELVAPMNSLLISKSNPEKEDSFNDLRENAERQSNVLLGKMGLSLFPGGK